MVARLDPTNGGALAELAAVPGVDLVAVPPAVSLMDATGLPTAAATAWQAMFEMAELRRGRADRSC